MKLGRQVLYLSYRDIVDLGIGMEECLTLVERVFRLQGEGRTWMPPKVGVYPSAREWYHAMPAAIEEFGKAVVKWQSGYASNRSHGLRYMQGALILNDLATGTPIAVMESTYLTALRTGAASGVAARWLARKGATHLAIIGCGVQAHTQLEALELVLPDLATVLCYDIVSAHAERFIEDVCRKYPGLDFARATSAREAIEPADVIVTAGPIVLSPERTLEASWFKKGALGLPIDYDCYWTAEAQQLADKIFVDEREQYEYARKTGYFQVTPAITGDMGDLAVGRVQGRASDEERILCFNLGVAIEDVAMADLAYRRALQAGVGTILPLYPD